MAKRKSPARVTEKTYRKSEEANEVWLYALLGLAAGFALSGWLYRKPG